MWVPTLFACLHLHTDLEEWPSHVHSARFNYVWITVTAVKRTSVSPLCCAILLEAETSEFLTFWEPSCYSFNWILNLCQHLSLRLLFARRSVVATLWIRLHFYSPTIVLLAKVEAWGWEGVQLWERRKLHILQDVRRNRDRQKQQHKCAGQTVAQGGGYDLLTPER